MRNGFFLMIILLGGLSPVFSAFAEEPCPTDEPAAEDPTTKCKVDLGQLSTPVFQFDQLKPKEAPSSEPAPEPVPEAKPAEVESAAAPVRPTPQTCHYSAYRWNVKTKRSTAPYSVNKAYAEVTDDERSPIEPRCTICLEDQTVISPKEFGVNLPDFRICYVYAEDVKNALAAIAADSSFRLTELTGYRPGRTRGKIVDDCRSEWSNHSFGTAIDINASQNGLYNNCPEPVSGSASEVASCKLGVGGKWDPQKRPDVSITKNGIVVKSFAPFWKWGGEISGNTKDIMHFSPDGY